MGGAATGQGEQQCVVGLCAGGCWWEAPGGLWAGPASAAGSGHIPVGCCKGNAVPCLKKSLPQ